MHPHDTIHKIKAEISKLLNKNTKNPREHWNFACTRSASTDINWSLQCATLRGLFFQVARSRSALLFSFLFSFSLAVVARALSQPSWRNVKEVKDTTKEPAHTNAVQQQHWLQRGKLHSTRRERREGKVEFVKDFGLLLVMTRKKRDLSYFHKHRSFLIFREVKKCFASLGSAAAAARLKVYEQSANNKQHTAVSIEKLERQMNVLSSLLFFFVCNFSFLRILHFTVVSTVCVLLISKGKKEKFSDVLSFNCDVELSHCVPFCWARVYPLKMMHIHNNNFTIYYTTVGWN